MDQILVGEECARMYAEKARAEEEKAADFRKKARQYWRDSAAYLKAALEAEELAKTYRRCEHFAWLF